MKKSLQFNMAIFLFFILFFGCEIEKVNDDNTGDDPPPIVSGQLTSHSDCKEFKSANTAVEIDDTLTCVEYIYLPSSNQLSLKHINAGFNCCPESLYCHVAVSNDTLIIAEFEQDGLCDCLCLFDLDIEADGIAAKKYIVKFIEPYIQDQDEILFEMDLRKDTTGSYCVYRDRYPWGVYYSIK